MLNCAVRSRAYALCIGLFLCSPFYAATAKEGRESGAAATNSGTTVSASSSAVTEFQWKDHNKLSWEDFRGPVNAQTDEAAAATHCSIGFKTNMNNASGKPEVIVYNKFYINKSWVRSDAKIPDILRHEQGHFDLCELYTRKLKQRMDEFNFSASVNLKQDLYNIYNEISLEYEKRQQAYEQETSHGTNLSVQRNWTNAIAGELHGVAAAF